MSTVTYACGNVARIGDLVEHVHRGQAIIARIERRDGLRPEKGRPDVVAPAGEAWMFAFNCRLERRASDWLFAAEVAPMVVEDVSERRGR